MAAAPWMELTYRMAHELSPQELRVVRQLPDVLGHGSSVLEVSRRVRESPERVGPLLEKLEDASVVSKEGSGLMNVQFGGDLYYLRPDAKEFFKYLSTASAVTGAK